VPVPGMAAGPAYRGRVVYPRPLTRIGGRDRCPLARAPESARRSVGRPRGPTVQSLLSTRTLWSWRCAAGTAASPGRRFSKGSSLPLPGARRLEAYVTSETRFAVILRMHVPSVRRPPRFEPWLMTTSATGAKGPRGSPSTSLVSGASRTPWIGPRAASCRAGSGTLTSAASPGSRSTRLDHAFSMTTASDPAAPSTISTRESTR